MKKFGYSLTVGDNVWYRYGHQFKQGEVLGFEEGEDPIDTLIIMVDGGSARMDEIFYTEREDITPEMIQDNINNAKMYIEKYEVQREALKYNIDRLKRDIEELEKF